MKWVHMRIEQASVDCHENPQGVQCGVLCLDQEDSCSGTVALDNSLGSNPKGTGDASEEGWF